MVKEKLKAAMMLTQQFKTGHNEDNILNILILYEPHCTYAKYHYNHLRSYAYFSKHKIFYIPAALHDKIKFNIDLDYFDVIILHYSVRLCFDWLEPSFVEPLQAFKGLKVVFIQDEYNKTEIERQWLERLQINLVFTCVPDEYREKVYPAKRFPQVKFIQVLTGYVPIEYQSLSQYIKPLNQRCYKIGYRGRKLPFHYGDLGREKWFLAQELRKICDERQLKTNIEWDENKKIFGDDWFHFLADCRVVIAMESGSNVFDDNGDIEKNIEMELQKNPSISYEEVHAKHMAAYEGLIKMNQISPRIFEAIAVKTGLVLFEGSYSNVVKPDIHYISLKKDFSNIDEVLRKINDDHFVSTLIERAYQDIILSGDYTYQKFIEKFDQEIETQVTHRYSDPRLAISVLVDPLLGSNSVIDKHEIDMAAFPSNLPLLPEQFLQLKTQLSSNHYVTQQSLEFEQLCNSPKKSFLFFWKTLVHYWQMEFNKIFKKQDNNMKGS